MVVYQCSRCADETLESKLKLFIGDYKVEDGWRSVHFNTETGLIEELDQDGEEVEVREPLPKELVIAVVEWCNANQDNSFPVALYSALNKQI